MKEILVISIATPLLIGVYENKKLIKTYEKEGMTSDILPLIFDEVLKENDDIQNIYYVNTPGSFMAIKVAYVFLKTISISNNINLLACEGFEFNEQTPIKALGKKYFIKQKDGIKVDFLDKDTKMAPFKLPKVLDKINYSNETLPIYNLPAV